MAVLKEQEMRETSEEVNICEMTSCCALCGEREVVQSDVRPHVPPHLRLERDCELCWVGEDNVSVAPLVSMVTSSRPHQQTGATGTRSEDLERERRET